MPTDTSFPHATPTIRGLPRPLPRVLEAYADRLDVENIREAYDLAVEAHAGQRRSPGEEYVNHRVDATILATLRLDSASLIARTPPCINETERRREIQFAYNEERRITPETNRKSVAEIEFSTRVADARGRTGEGVEEPESCADEINREEYVKIIETEMEEAAETPDVGREALLPDPLFELKTTAAK